MIKYFIIYLLGCLTLVAQPFAPIPLSIANSSVVVQPSCGSANTSGLVAWWTMDDNIGKDIIGGFNLTWSGGIPVSSAGQISNCVTLNSSSSQYGNAGANSALTPSNFTYTAWVNTSGAAGVLVVVGGASSDYPAFRINDFQLQLISEGNFVLSTSTGSITDGAWHYIAVTATYGVSGTVTFYIDGSASGSSTQDTTVFANSATYIGASGTAGPGQFFNGKLDDVRIYNRALSVSEISGTYTTNTCGCGFSGGNCP